MSVADPPGRQDEPPLDRTAVESVDVHALMRDVEAQPHQLVDALWRVESARLGRRERAGGLIVAGMGGSAIGGDLAAAAIGRRRRAPVRTVRRGALDASDSRDALVLCASYSGETEETLACFGDAGSAGADRVALTTGGRLAERARAEGVPVIGVPAGLQPRAAVAYTFVGALECAALCGAAPPLRSEIEAGSRRLDELVAEWGPDSPEQSLPKRLARRLLGRLPVIYGAAATAPVAYRWKAQINENAKQHAFSSELPEADHNELMGWEGSERLARFAAILLEDEGADSALGLRLALTAREIGAIAPVVEQVPSFGSTPVERVVAATLLGDLVSVYLAVLRGVDPTPVQAIERFKRRYEAAQAHGAKGPGPQSR